MALTRRRSQKCVALKISVSERSEKRQEAAVLRTIAATRSDHPGLAHLLSTTDHFQLVGPNGLHECHVLDMLGPCLPDALEQMFRPQRLPGWLAKRIAKQTLLGLDYLHQRGISHGGLS